jgi:hypothetical protein
VRAYDADDLETWLELAPAVHVWISIQIGKHPEGLTDLESYWLAWSQDTKPSLSTELLLAGREESAEKIRNWSLNGTDSLAVTAESAEAVAIVAATALQLPPEARSLVLSRVVIVRDRGAWEYLSGLKSQLILISAPGLKCSVAQAIEGGNRVLVAVGASDDEASDTIVVPQLDTGGAAKALAVAGLDDARAGPGTYCAPQRQGLP